jgi:hypothetical protein
MNNSSRDLEYEMDQHWHLDRKIPIAFILTLLAQTFLGGWWAATTSARLEALYNKVDSLVEDRYTKKEADLQFRFSDTRLKELERWKSQHMQDVVRRGK